jgi:hypothetical protein
MPRLTVAQLAAERVLVVAAEVVNDLLDVHRQVEGRPVDR